MLTIGIILYNEEKRLAPVERNLACLRASPDVELVLVDNASRDGTLPVLKNLAATYGARLIARHENHLGAARADVVNAARGTWVGFIDADCLISEAWLPTALRVIQSDPPVAAVGGPLWPGGKRHDFYRRLFKSFLGNMNSVQVKRFTAARTVRHLPTANVLYRREDLLHIGNFDLNKSRAGEDLDVSYRLRRRGKTLRLEPDLALIHDLPETFSAWIKKVFIYGKARGEVGYEQRALLTYPFLLPLLFGAFVCACVISFPQLKGLPFIVYLLGALTQAALHGGKKTPALFGHLLAMHFVYAAGMWWAIFKKINPVSGAAH